MDKINAASQEETGILRKIAVKYFVVGAGLAGCSLGYLLCRGGEDVLAAEILDGKTKDKLCGGIMLDISWNEFAAVFQVDWQKQFHPVPMKEICYCLGDIKYYRRSNFLVIPRKIVDDYALESYIAAGGRLMDKTAVQKIDMDKGIAECVDLRRKEKFLVRFENIIGADGAISHTRKLVTGTHPRAFMSFQAEVLPKHDGLIFDSRFDVVGYNWHIPMGNHALVGSFYQDVAPAVCRNYFDEFAGRLGVTPQKIRGAYIPTGDDICLRAKGNGYFVGDAAGLVHGADGGGIIYALRSARFLAEYFLGGRDYEEAMQMDVETVRRLTLQKAKIQFFNNMLIAKKGGVWGKRKDGEK